MTRIRTLVLAAGILALPVGAAQAQDTARMKQPRSRAEMAERTVRPVPVARLIAMRAELKLTDEQVASLTAIQSKYQGMRREAREKMQAERRAYLEANPEIVASRKQLSDNAKAARAEVEAVLTAEQKTLIEQRMQRVQRRRGGRGA